jgi:hypothetical protein
MDGTIAKRITAGQQESIVSLSRSAHTKGRNTAKRQKNGHNNIGASLFPLLFFTIPSGPHVPAVKRAMDTPQVWVKPMDRRGPSIVPWTNSSVDLNTFRYALHHPSCCDASAAAVAAAAAAEEDAAAATSATAATASDADAEASNTADADASDIVWKKSATCDGDDDDEAAAAAVAAKA